MIHLLSPAKSLDFSSNIDLTTATEPQFLREAEKLVRKLRTTSKKKIKDLMSISDALVQLNAQRYQTWQGKTELSEESRQAIFAFTGDVYQGLDVNSLKEEDLKYAQEHLMILSGIYGVLRPLDVMEPYRLEMGTSLKVGRAKNLYEYWKDKPTELINERLREQENSVLVNLASNEYFKVVNKKKLEGTLIHPEFKDAKNGNYKIISFFAKKARGYMSRYIIENQISDPKDLEGFDTAGYRFNKDLS
ncbi:MAG: peroxide stress protein YaaA, partial [Flavobacteriales bacterium]|nr:peroxide stress protein YaaA [Flavobacteriales bacterium]